MCLRPDRELALSTSPLSHISLVNCTSVRALSVCGMLTNNTGLLMNLVSFPMCYQVDSQVFLSNEGNRFGFIELATPC